MAAGADAGSRVEGALSRSSIARFGGDCRGGVLPSGGRAIRRQRRQRHPVAEDSDLSLMREGAHSTSADGD